MQSKSIPARRSGALCKSLVLATLGLSSLHAQAGTTLYRYTDQGMPVYSNRKPAEGIAYTVVTASPAMRPVARVQLPSPPASAAQRPLSVEEAPALTGWAASCVGITEKDMQARAEQLDPIVTRNAKRHRVPAALVRAVMRVESCFDLRAVSRVGARGVMQLMPATALALGVRDSFNAEQNIAGGVRFLRSLLERFDHDVRLAVAAYNAGPTAVARHKGIPPFPETRQYVERVMAAYRKTGAGSRSS